jgi:hypothetical protein
MNWEFLGRKKKTEDSWEELVKKTDKEADYCPICGQKFKTNLKNGSHQCPDTVLRAIDAAHTRDDITEFLNTKPFGQRLADGFDMLKRSGDQD